MEVVIGELWHLPADLELARNGQFPCRVIRIGDTYRVPTAALLELLGVAPEAPKP